MLQLSLSSLDIAWSSYNKVNLLHNIHQVMTQWFEIYVLLYSYFLETGI